MVPLAVAVLGTLALLFAAGAGASSSAKPSLRLLRLAPLRVAGTRFAGAERVRVVVRTGRTYSRRIVQASTTGDFAVSFGTVGADRCTSFRVIAVGNEGSRAVLKPLPRPACMPARAGRGRR
jgi:hypothetical protein